MPNAMPEVGIPRPDGLQLHPFVGCRYNPQRVDPGRVLAPPYDVIDAAERRRLLDLDEHNVVRLTLPEGDGEGKYRTAAELLHAWRASKVLISEDAPSLYVYEQATADHTQRGLLGALALTPAEDGIVLPHENTMAGPVADRLALTDATEANLEPIFCVYDGGGPATAAVAGVDEHELLVEATDLAGVRHRIWRLSDPGVLHEVARDLAPRRAVIADGHHRYATYLAHQRQQHEAGRGAGAWDRGLTFLVDSGRFGPQVHAIHRVVPGLRLDAAIEGARRGFRTVREVDSASGLLDAARSAPAFVVTDGRGTFWLLADPEPDVLAEALPAERSAAWRDLHVSVAHNLLFRSLWGLDDREGVVDFAHDEAEAVTAAREAGGVAVLLAPTPVSAVAAVAAAGERMPRKSTLFVPKPATGMVLRVYADEADAAR